MPCIVSYANQLIWISRIFKAFKYTDNTSTNIEPEFRYLRSILICLFASFSCVHQPCSHQPRGVSYMVGICRQNVHSSQHLLARPGFWHDASGPGLCYSAAQHVWSEEHLRPGHVRHRTDLRGGAVTCHDLCLSAGSRSSHACWWHPRMAFSTFIMWTLKMEESVS